MIDHIERPTEAESRRRLRELDAEALPVYAHVFAGLPRHGRLVRPPILHVGTKARPDVADLLRLHRQEGDGYEGDAWSQLFAVTGRPIGEPRVFAHVRQLVPARCEFKLRFRLGRHRAILEAVALSGLVGITAEAPRVRDGQIVTPVLVLEVSGVELLRALLVDQERRAERVWALGAGRASCGGGA